VCLHVRMNVHVCVHMYAKYENHGFAVYMYVCIYVCRSLSMRFKASLPLLCDSCTACMHCVCVCGLCACLHVCMNVHACVYMYAKYENHGIALCMYVYIYV